MAGGGGGGRRNPAAENQTEEEIAFAFRFVVLFTVINLLTYFDRGAFSAALDTISSKSVYNMDTFQAGFVGSTFMVGYVTASPIFSNLSSIYNPMRLMTIGLLIWCVAVVFSGLSVGFWSLTMARMLSGVGEASFLCIAPCYIERSAPEDLKNKWLSIFYMGIPVGFAIGSVVMSEYIKFGPGAERVNWRYVFFFECILMVLIMVYVNAGPQPKISFVEEHHEAQAIADPSSVDRESLIIAKEGEEGQTVEKSVWETLDVLKNNNIWVYLSFAYGMQTFVSGGFAYFGADYVEKGLGAGLSTAGIGFGVLTIFCGIAGTWFGGWYVDKKIMEAVDSQNLPHIGPVLSADAQSVSDFESINSNASSGPLLESEPNDLAGPVHPVQPFDEEESEEVKIMRMVIGSYYVVRFNLIAFPFVIFSFLFKSIPLFFLGLTVAEFFIFASFPVINQIIIASVPLLYSSDAVAYSVIVIHVFGDALSPLIIGKVVDSTGSWQFGMGSAGCVLGIAIWLFSKASSATQERAEKLDQQLAQPFIG